ncbi:MAG TPA: hypothetical protein DD706_11420 [Nitrospiraceae bacterium]|nr:hypothetical protein [Nitrospiraceae bacterium]
MFSEGETLLPFPMVLARCITLYRWLRRVLMVRGREIKEFKLERDVIIRNLPENFSGSSETVGRKVFMPRALTNLKGAST